MQLSIRMQAVADMVTPGGKVADVGTDHGYVPIYLIEQNKAFHAIAMDVRKGPLARAGENIVRFGCSGRIETRLSDGLERLEPNEADTVIIAYCSYSGSGTGSAEDGQRVCSAAAV